MSGIRSVRWTAMVLALSGLAGVAALIWGQTQQVYRVPYEEASVAFIQWCTGEPGVDPVAGDHYLAMFGDRYAWTDLGLGLTTTALAGLVLAAALIVTRSEMHWLQTPSRRWPFMLGGWAVIAWTFLSVTYSLRKDLERRQLPWCADSIAIPIFETSVFSLVLLPICSIVGGLLMTRFGALPVSLNRWDHGRPRYSWIMTIVFGAIIFLLGFLMIEQATISMSIANPALLLAIYLSASTRAALLAPKPVSE